MSENNFKVLFEDSEGNQSELPPELRRIEDLPKKESSWKRMILIAFYVVRIVFVGLSGLAFTAFIGFAPLELLDYVLGYFTGRGFYIFIFVLIGLYSIAFPLAVLVFAATWSWLEWEAGRIDALIEKELK